MAVRVSVVAQLAVVESTATLLEALVSVEVLVGTEKPESDLVRDDYVALFDSHAGYGGSEGSGGGEECGEAHGGWLRGSCV